MFAVPDHSVALHLKCLTGFGAVNITQAALLCERCVSRNANIKRSFNTCGLSLTSNLTSPMRGPPRFSDRFSGSFPTHYSLFLPIVSVFSLNRSSLCVLKKCQEKNDLGAHETHGCRLFSLSKFAADVGNHSLVLLTSSKKSFTKIFSVPIK